jgi:hypothetical protein
VDAVIIRNSAASRHRGTLRGRMKILAYRPLTGANRGTIAAIND